MSAREFRSRAYMNISSPVTDCTEELNPRYSTRQHEVHTIPRTLSEETHHHGKGLVASYRMALVSSRILQPTTGYFLEYLPYCIQGRDFWDACRPPRCPPALSPAPPFSRIFSAAFTPSLLPAHPGYILPRCRRWSILLMPVLAVQ